MIKAAANWALGQKDPPTKTCTGCKTYIEIPSTPQSDDKVEWAHERYPECVSNSAIAEGSWMPTKGQKTIQVRSNDFNRSKRGLDSLGNIKQLLNKKLDAVAKSKSGTDPTGYMTNVYSVETLSAWESTISKTIWFEYQWCSISITNENAPVSSSLYLVPVVALLLVIALMTWLFCRFRRNLSGFLRDVKRVWNGPQTATFRSRTRRRANTV